MKRIVNSVLIAVFLFMMMMPVAFSQPDPGHNGDGSKVGVTDYAQKSLKEVVLVSFEVDSGDAVEKGGVLGTIESVKTASDLISPIAGTVKAINEALDDDPALTNTDPYGEGWLIELEGASIDGLLDAAAYGELLKK